MQDQSTGTTPFSTFSTEEYAAFEATQTPNLQSKGSKRDGTSIKTQQAVIGTLPREIRAEMCHLVHNGKLVDHEEYVPAWKDESYDVSPDVPDAWEHSPHSLDISRAASRCKMQELQNAVLKILTADNGLNMPDVYEGLERKNMSSRKEAQDYDRTRTTVDTRDRTRGQGGATSIPLGLAAQARLAKYNHFTILHAFLASEAARKLQKDEPMAFREQRREIDEIKKVWAAWYESSLAESRASACTHESASSITSHSTMFRLIDKLYSTGNTMLTNEVLRRHASKTLQMKDNEELKTLRSRYPTFHEDLHGCLVMAAKDNEEVVENEDGNWMVRSMEVGGKLKAKL